MFNKQLNFINLNDIVYVEEVNSIKGNFKYFDQYFVFAMPNEAIVAHQANSFHLNPFSYTNICLNLSVKLLY